MIEVGVRCDIAVFALLFIFFLLFIALALLLDLTIGVILCILAISFLIVQWKLKQVIITSSEVSFTGMFGKKETYPIDSIEGFGYFIYPICYVVLKDGKQFIFQIPMKHLFITGFPGRINTKSYLDILAEQLNRVKTVKRF
jgi:hypothetical protein